MCASDSVGGRPPPVLHGFDPAVEIDLEPVDSVRITTLMDNVTDIFMPDQGPAHRVPLGEGPRRAAAVMDNGIDGLIRTLGRTNLPVLIHPHFWRRRRVALLGREPLEIPTTSRRALEEAGFDVIEEQQPSFLFERSVLVTGEVPRTTGYEPGFPPQQAWLHNSWQPDPLVLDDQALILNLRGKGLVVLTGCGHAGVVNIARYAQRLTGDQPLHALLGGFHLNGPLFEPLIPRVLDDLAALHPSVLVPAHCTGWRAQHAMSARFGRAFIPNSVGTSFHL